MTTPVPQENQCDGCRRGLPINTAGHHVGPKGFWGGDVQACTAYLYGHAPLTKEKLSEQEFE